MKTVCESKDCFRTIRTNTCCEGRPEATAKVSRSLKMTFTQDTSLAHHPSFSLGETFSLELVRNNTFPSKSDLVCPVAWPVQELFAYKENTP